MKIREIIAIIVIFFGALAATIAFIRKSITTGVSDAMRKKAIEELTAELNPKEAPPKLRDPNGPPSIKEVVAMEAQAEDMGEKVRLAYLKRLGQMQAKGQMRAEYFKYIKYAKTKTAKEAILLHEWAEDYFSAWELIRHRPQIEALYPI